MKEFVSKRNRVWLENGEVHKVLPDEATAVKEAGFLRMLREKGVAVPAVLRREGRELVMEHVLGVALPDLLGGLEMDWFLVAGALVDWLAAFYHAVDHRATGEIRGDVNGRNFIFRAFRVYGVDFEEHCFGTRERDAGRMLAFVQTYDAPQKNRSALAEELEIGFRDALGLDMGLVEAERQKERKEIERRRA